MLVAISVMVNFEPKWSNIQNSVVARTIFVDIPDNVLKEHDGQLQTKAILEYFIIKKANKNNGFIVMHEGTSIYSFKKIFNIAYIRSISVEGWVMVGEEEYYA